MKKIILTMMALFAVSLTVEVNAQCSTGSAFWGQYPSSTQSAPTTVGEETVVFGGSYAGEYMRVSGFQAGAVYEWSLCGNNYDTQLTIRNWNTGAVVAYNDDSCGLQSRKTFTSDGSDLRVQVNEWPCDWNFTLTTHRATLISVPVVGEPPVIQCPTDVIVANDEGDCGAIVNFADAVSIDPEDGLLAVTQVAGLASGSQFPVGVSSVTFEATDSDGNTEQCSFTITVEDTEVPVITTFSEVTIELGTTGEYTLNSTDLIDSESDNCGVTSYNIYLAGAAPVSECATDLPLAVGPSPSVTESVISISDVGSIGTQYEVTNVSLDITHTWDSDLEIQLVSPSGTVHDLSMRNGGSGDNYTNTVFADGGQDITEADAPFDGTFEPEGGTFAAAYDGEGISGDWTLRVTDNAFGDGGTLNSFCITLTPLSGGPTPALPLLTCSDIGTWNVAIVATDAAGNSSVEGTTQVTVQDTTAPEIICDGEPLAGDILEDFNGTSIPAGWTNVTLRGDSAWGFGTGVFQGPFWPEGYDFSSNAALFDDDLAGPGDDAAQLISPVYDLDGVDTATLSFDYAMFYTGFAAEFLSAEVYDGAQWVEIFRLEQDATPTNTGDIDVIAYANENFQVRFTYDDGGDNWNWGAGVDNFHLSYFAPSSIVQVVLDSNGLANYDASDLLLDVVEGCDYTVTVDVPGEVSGDLTTLFAANNGGNPGGAVYFDLTVVEDIALTALDVHTGATGAFTVEMHVTEEGGTYIGNENNPGAWELAGTASGDGQGAGTPSFATFADALAVEPGTYGVALVLSADHDHDYTNGDGTNQNYATAELEFSGGSATNVPFTGPVFSPRIFNGRFYYDYMGVTAAENFDFDCSYLGINDIEVTVTDDSGNVSTCISQVEVLDVDDPILICQDAIVSLDENGMAEVLPEYFISSDSFDNCGITITAVDVTDVTCADIGVPITVTVFVSDDGGNIASCQATMTVVDDMAPVLEGCPEDMTVDPGAVDLFYEVPDYTADIVATDNCSDPVGAVTQDPPAGTLLPDGVYTVTFSATDDEGNVGTCSFELTVESVLGVTSNQLNAGVAIYPNPARNVMNIGNSTDIQLERAVIYDLNGRMIQSIDLSDMSAEASVNVAHLASGVYMVQLQAQDGQAIKRLVKE
jgi:subtilisin-like proprotein convertase family protein